MLHTANIKMAELSSRALGIPITFGFTKGEKEAELADILRTVSDSKRKFRFQYLGSGGICSEYQRSRLEKIASEADLGSLAPLWGIDQRSYLEELARRKYRYILTSVSAAGLDEKWLGRMIDESSLKDLLKLSEKYRFNPALEGGEGETLVLDCPIFTNGSIEIVESEKSWDGFRCVLTIKKARLFDK